MNILNEGPLFIPHKVLFNVWNQEASLKQKNAAVLHFVLEKFGMDKSDDYMKIQEIKTITKNFTNKVAEKWVKSNRNVYNFNEQYSNWLNNHLVFSMGEDRVKPSASVQWCCPIKSFEDSSAKTKKRMIKPLLESWSTEELTFAAASSLRKSGRKYAAAVVEDASVCTPDITTSMKKCVKSPAPTPIKYTNEEALALYIDGNFTKSSYILMQKGAKNRRANIYPPYHCIKWSKKECYPEECAILFNEMSAEVQLQALINHTVKRIVGQVKNELLEKLNKVDPLNLFMMFKWGCDDSSDHSKNKLKFTNLTGIDECLFSVFIVPLQLYAHAENGTDNIIIWHNESASSTRFCRPVRIIFERESTELIQKEIAKLQTQIEKLEPTKFHVMDHKVSVKHVLNLTTKDGKRCNVTSDTPSIQPCGICRGTPKEKNTQTYLQSKQVNPELYENGFSALHAWIRCFECLLHIAFRLEIKYWQIRGEENKKIFQQRKAEIREKLKVKMGLLVDIPKPGYGTTNDGNTARQFFHQPLAAALCTGINLEIIQRFGVILKTISCGFAIDLKAFGHYTKETAEKYLELYSWYYMPDSVHKLLVHGSETVKAAILPIGIYSEEALASRNKELRRYHRRKSSRNFKTIDLFHTLLYSSDPVISSISSRNKIVRVNSKAHLDVEVQRLLN